MNKFKLILEEGIKAAKEGNSELALTKFKEALKLPRNKIDEPWVVHLFRHTAIIYEKKGNLRQAKRCALQSLKYDESDPYTYFWLGGLSERLQQVKAAGQYYARCRELALRNQDEDLLQMLSQRGHHGRIHD